MLSVSSKRKLHLSLFKHSIDTAQLMGLRVGQHIEPVERVGEICQSLVVGPTALGLFCGRDSVIDCFVSLVAPTEVQRQHFCHFIGTPTVKLLECVPDGSVAGPATSL